MVIDRALEIFNSTDENITVLYANKPVWIESIDKSNGTAVITVLGTNQTETVPISSLTDTGSKM
ncbi:H-type small acid-soluble spore protein [Clostridium sp. SYSU_GA19001]|uniref:H-type small acid-soluble spore protein n=1 Tax=Clostridium caldaquaticum TaxID=2940653 RepID=UPI002076D9F0|nr:H-type small acid-soluble spore protein [Clostridium caldaquaticum]MCM8711119.1 H-type small acid-soluble spore protein [Clostridium caldaquaticum]